MGHRGYKAVCSVVLVWGYGLVVALVLIENLAYGSMIWVVRVNR
jgi:hypothetical protein